MGDGRAEGPSATWDAVKVKVSQSCPTLCDPTDYTGHGVLQARTLEWVAFPLSRGSSWPRNWTRVSCTAGIFFTNWAIREAQEMEGKLKFQLHLNVDGTHIRYLWKFLTWRFIKKGLTGFRLLMGLRFSQFKHFFLGWAFSSPPACSIYSHLVSASSISMHFQYALFSFTIHSFLGPLKSGSSDHTLLQ